MTTKISPDMLPAFQGVIPPTLATVSKEGVPNVTYISQVFYIDEDHVALSRQFFNKTWKNIADNPKFAVAITCPESFSMWKITLEYKEEKREGNIFEEMDMMINAIASMQGLEDVFQLDSAVICKVLSIETPILHGEIN